MRSFRSILSTRHKNGGENEKREKTVMVMIYGIISVLSTCSVPAVQVPGTEHNGSKFLIY